MMLAIQTGLIGLGPLVRPAPCTITSAGSAARAPAATMPMNSATAANRLALFLTGHIHLYDFGNFRVILENDRSGPRMSGLAQQGHVRQLQDHCGFCLRE